MSERDYQTSRSDKPYHPEYDPRANTVGPGQMKTPTPARMVVISGRLSDGVSRLERIAELSAKVADHLYGFAPPPSRPQDPRPAEGEAPWAVRQILVLDRMDELLDRLGFDLERMAKELGSQ